MRNLDERMAEISRRSEVIIKERMQRRKHILTACIPLVVCIAMFSAFILPAIMPEVSSDRFAPESAGNLYVSGTGDDGLTLFVGAVEVSGTGVSHYYTSVEDVQKIIGLINCIVAVPETEKIDGNDLATNESASNRDEAYEANDYTIIITHSDGTSTEYLLLGTMLIDQYTKEVFHLEEKISFELKDALGIPRY